MAEQANIRRSILDPFDGGHVVVVSAARSADGTRIRAADRSMTVVGRPVPVE